MTPQNSMESARQTTTKYGKIKNLYNILDSVIFVVFNFNSISKQNGKRTI